MQAARMLAMLGAVLLAVAGMLWLLARLGAERIGLPGTVTVRSGNFTLFAPIGLWILLSLVLTVVLNLLVRLFR
jgi:hypothetical protein